MVILAFFVLHWQLSVFMQTFFLHRYGAHRMFTMSKGWERFFYVLTYVAQGSLFLVPRERPLPHTVRLRPRLRGRTFSEHLPHVMHEPQLRPALVRARSELPGDARLR